MLKNPHFGTKVAFKRLKKGFFMSFRLIIAVLCWTVVGCIPRGDRSVSGLKLGDAFVVTTETEYTRPMTALYRRSQAGEYRPFCSNTFLGDRTSITALHCVDDGLLPAIKMDNGTPITARKIYLPKRIADLYARLTNYGKQISELSKRLYEVSPTCKSLAPEARSLRGQINNLLAIQQPMYQELAKGDLAIIVWPKGTGTKLTQGGRYYGIAERHFPPVNSPTKHIAFGAASSKPRPESQRKSCQHPAIFEGVGTKRIGTNLSRRDGDKVILESFHSADIARANGSQQGMDVDIKPGDSGSSWIDCGGMIPCESFDIMAITSIGTDRPDGSSRATASYLKSNTAKELFRQAIECNHSDPSMCAEPFRGSGFDRNVFVYITNKPSGDQLQAVSAPKNAKTFVCSGKDVEACNASSSYKVAAKQATAQTNREVLIFDKFIPLANAAEHFVTVVGVDASGKRVFSEVLQMSPLAP